MVRMRKAVLAISAALLCAGCTHFSEGNRTADYPEAKQFPQIYQAKLMAAAHWQLIAENEAELIAERFSPGSAFTLAASGPGQSTETRSDFAVAYHHMLSQGLLNNQMRVFDQGADFQLNFHIQVLSHSERSQGNLPAMFFTGTTAAAFVIGRGLQMSRPEMMLFPIAAGIDGYNLANSDTDTPNTEIILTTSIRASTEVVYSHSSVYYFRTADQQLYDGVAPEVEVEVEVENPRRAFNVAGRSGAGN